MRLLIDTHVLVWAMLMPEMLSDKVRTLIEDNGVEVFVSAASAYEIEYKRTRDPTLTRLPPQLPGVVVQLGYGWLAINELHAAEAASLDWPHRDPWDRLLAAQARIEGMPLATNDGKLTAFSPLTVW